MALAAGGQRVDLVETRRVLVARHQPGLVAAETAAAHQHIVAAGGRERLGQQDAALQVVDVVVQPRAQVHHAGDQPRVLVAHLDAQALGAGEDVLVAQEEQRAAGAAELVAAGNRAGLGGEAVDASALFAEAVVASACQCTLAP